MAVALADLLDENQVVLDLRTREMPAALGKIVQVVAANGKIGAPEKFLEQLLAREQSKPSAVEDGVVFPHIRTDLVDEIVIGIGRSRSGIPFADQKRARLIFLVGVPQQMVNDYLVCVGALARLLRNEETRATLLEIDNARGFIDALLATPGTI